MLRNLKGLELEIKWFAHETTPDDLYNIVSCKCPTFAQQKDAHAIKKDFHVPNFVIALIAATHMKRIWMMMMMKMNILMMKTNVIRCLYTLFLFILFFLFLILMLFCFALFHVF